MSILTRHIKHHFFTREGGASEGIYASRNCGPGSKDNAAAISENRARCARDLGGVPESLCTLSQIHSADVMTVKTAFVSGEHPDGDALVTSESGIILGILTADCCPVLFADKTHGVIGAAHAGWKGAIGGVLENTISAMEALGAARDTITAHIGPTIRQTSYEVSADFRDQFVEEDAGYAQFFVGGARPDHFQFDLPDFVRFRLQKAGVGAITDCEEDTYSNEDRYFSYRRTTHRGESDYGRQLSAIVMGE